MSGVHASCVEQPGTCSLGGKTKSKEKPTNVVRCKQPSKDLRRSYTTARSSSTLAPSASV